MNKKMLILIPVLLILGGAGYKFTLGKSHEKAPEPKIHGTVTQMQPEFIINLEGGRFAKFTVGLELEHDDPSLAATSGGEHGAAKPGEPVPLEQGALIRSIITDTVTGSTADRLLSRDRRKELLGEIKRKIRRMTDQKVGDVFFTDLAVD